MNFKLRIVEHLCADQSKLNNLIEVLSKYNISLASYFETKNEKKK